MAIAPITTSDGSAAAAAGPNPGLGKDDFLRLLVTQLRNQDPLQPLDQNQFLAQTAQFSSLEQLQNISRGLNTLGQMFGSSLLIDAAGLVGHTARATAREFTFDGNAMSLSFQLDTPVSDVAVEVLDGNGNVVRSLDSGSADAGFGAVSWDGLDSSGRALAPGTYTYRVSVPGTAAGQLSPVVAIQGTIDGLEVRGGRIAYTIGGTVVHQDDIVQIH